jgi:hypothetical protein
VWSDEGVFQAGRLLRSLHDTTADFMPPPGAAWHPWPFASDAPDAVISHRDTGPWNIVARAAQLRYFADGCRLAAGRQGLVTAMIVFAIRGSAAEAIQAGVTPEAGDCGALWAITWRARSAA